MLTAETLPAEGARYTATLLLLPELWAGPAAWRGCASFLAHRGWTCHLLDPRRLGADMEARAAAVAEYAAAIEERTVLVGHGAGAILALGAARRRPPAALVLLGPLPAGSPGARALVLRPRALMALVAGTRVPPPARRAADLLLGGLPPAGQAAVASGLAPDAAPAVRDVVWGRWRPPAVPGVPALVVSGDRDRLLPPARAAAFARAIGARHEVLPEAGHWILAGPAWQRTVALVHRWLVQELGAALLELYEEAMAEREVEPDDSDG
jgi:pimeloyl-ACP methyl ester carboxylesterase